MSESSSFQPAQPTLWEKTKGYSSTAYNKALKPGFDKAYVYVDKLGAPVNRLSNKLGNEAFWPTTLDKESEKCARILRTFCKDGFYDKINEEAAKKAEADRRDPLDNTPQMKTRNIVKIPAKVIKKAVGLAIFTTMRTGWIFGGSGGAGVLIARHPETGEWSPPSGIMVHIYSIGFLIGVDVFDTVLVINNYRALEAFTKLRATLGTEVGVTAGPVGAGAELDSQIHKRPSPVWAYVKSRGVYAGVALAGNIVIVRTDENEKFYGEPVEVADILVGKLRYPPVEQYKILLDTAKAAQGDDVDDSLLPVGDAPGDYEFEDKGSFGVPSHDDDDPYGVKALAAEGLVIREAGTHQRASVEDFEFKPSPSSPIYPSYRKSMDASIRRRTDSCRNSSTSLASTDRGTQTMEDEGASPMKHLSRPSSLRHESPRPVDGVFAHEPSIDEHNPIHEASVAEENAALEEEETGKHDEISDIDSDAEIGTVVHTATQARVVNVPKREPPALPPRNPGRALPQSNGHFTVKFKTAQDLAHQGLVLRTSTDNWMQDRAGELKDGIWHFDLDTTIFSDDFECKFVIPPNRWMHDPNLVVASPAAGEDIVFTDSRVIFPDENSGPSSAISAEMQDVSLEDHKRAPSVTDGEDQFVSVPHTPELEQAKPNDM